MRRLWLDANVVLRLLTGIPEDMANRSRQLMRKAEQGDLVLVLTTLVLAQIIWVLKSLYKKSISEIQHVLVPFLCSDGLEVEERDLVIHAIELSQDRNVEFIDAYIALKASQAGQEVCTFDEADFKKLPAKWTLPPG